MRATRLSDFTADLSAARLCRQLLLVIQELEEQVRRCCPLHHVPHEDPAHEAKKSVFILASWNRCYPIFK